MRLSVAVVPLDLQVASVGLVRFSHHAPAWLDSVSVAVEVVTPDADSAGAGAAGAEFVHAPSPTPLLARTATTYVVHGVVYVADGCGCG